MGRRRAGRLVLTAAMLAAGVALFLGPVEALPPTPSPMRLPWPVLAALFAAAVILRVQVQTDREVHSITLVELPMVLGLFLVDPLGLVVARVAGSIPALLHAWLAQRKPAARRPGRRPLFDTSLALLEASVAVVVFDTARPGTRSPCSAASWRRATTWRRRWRPRRRPAGCGSTGPGRRHRSGRTGLRSRRRTVAERGRCMAGGEVRLVGLVKRFEDVAAVDGIDLEVRGGELFSLLGPSGCGKTTTLRLVAGFEQPTAGAILLDGVDMARTPPHKRRVNTVFQSYALFPFMSVHDNVAFGLRFQDVARAEARRRVAAALELVQLQGLGRRRPAQLSGGQQQRVALARALVLEPSVLLLDEPLGALDAKLRKALQVELKALQEAVGITFLYVTHDQEEALTQ